MLDVLAYADAAGVNHRTVREWLKRDLLPGATQDARGKWWIPANAQRVDAGAVEIHTQATPATPATLPRAFYTVDEAAHLLGLTPYRVAQERDALEIVAWGPNGQLLVPAYVIRRYLG